jgi:hypothetical protein
MLREPTVAGIGQLAAMQTRGAVIWGGVCTENSDSHVVVMQSAEEWL